MQKFLESAIELATKAGSKLILALLIYIIGRMVIKSLMKAVGKIKALDKADPTVRSFALNAVRFLLYTCLVVAIINVLGVDTSSVIAVIASCGVAVGLALQGALANIAGGIMLLIFRPFNVGDYVVTGSGEGVVKSISLFYTVLTTLDNKKVTVPNGALMNAAVTNLSSEPNRRVDLTFNLTGAEDISRVQEVLLGEALKNEKVLKDPAPFAGPAEGIPGGLQYTLRVWTESANYWDVYFDLMKAVPTALGQAGIGGPQPVSKVLVDK